MTRPTTPPRSICSQEAKEAKGGRRCSSPQSGSPRCWYSAHFLFCSVWDPRPWNINSYLHGVSSHLNQTNLDKPLWACSVAYLLVVLDPDKLTGDKKHQRMKTTKPFEPGHWWVVLAWKVTGTVKMLRVAGQRRASVASQTSSTPPSTFSSRG